MSYRLLDPLARDRRFQLLERDRSFRLVEGLGDSLKQSAQRATSGEGGGQDFAKDLIKGGEAKSGLGRLLGWNRDTKFIDRLQDTVDLVGVVDPSGVADAANALTYAARGKWGHAATSALGIIPYLGDLGKIGKYASRGAKAGGKAAKVERAATKIAARKAATKAGAGAAEKGLGRAALDTARKTRFGRGLEVGAKRKMGRYGRSALKMLSGEGKLRGKVGKAAQRVQDFRQTGAGQKIEKNIRAKLSGGEPQRPDTTADLGRRGTGPLSKEAPAPSLAPPDPGPRAKEREAEQLPQRKAATDKAATGGASRTKVAGRLIVPVDANCPSGKTKTSTWGAPDGMKRCFKQTPGRER